MMGILCRIDLNRVDTSHWWQVYTAQVQYGSEYGQLDIPFEGEQKISKAHHLRLFTPGGPVPVSRRAAYGNVSRSHSSCIQITLSNRSVLVSSLVSGASCDHRC